MAIALFPRGSTGVELVIVPIQSARLRQPDDETARPSLNAGCFAVRETIGIEAVHNNGHFIEARDDMRKAIAICVRKLNGPPLYARQLVEHLRASEVGIRKSEI